MPALVDVLFFYFLSIDVVTQGLILKPPTYLENHNSQSFSFFFLILSFLGKSHSLVKVAVFS